MDKYEFSENNFKSKDYAQDEIKIDEEKGEKKRE